VSAAPRSGTAGSEPAGGWVARRVTRRRAGPGRPSRAPVLLRQVPGDTSIHRLWAGTKLVAVVVVSVVVSFTPTWTALALFAAILAVAARLARIPRAAVPVPPMWFWVAMGAGAALTLASGGAPEVRVGGAHVGFGDLELYVRFTFLAAVVLGASAMVAWTTPLGDLAPALARLGGPLRHLRLPVDEWAVTVALCVRSLPLLFEELRVLVAARRLRSRPVGRRSVDAWLQEAIDLMTATLAASIRRAGEMGEAITARGGTGQVAAPGPGPGPTDAAALAVVAVVATAALLAGVV
jgi:energy-coupling factor transport system permease protein